MHFIGLHFTGFAARLPLVALIVSMPLLGPGIGSAQTTGGAPLLSVDAPEEGAVLNIGDDWYIGGWAADPRAPNGPGITRIEISLDGPADAGGTRLGQAYYGTPRPDVAASMQRPDWDASGFLYKWSAPFMQPGGHTLFVQARSALGESTVRSIPVLLQGTRRTCTLTNPCRTSTDEGEWVDDGGPTIRFEYNPRGR
jgi:hypothetical protein